MSEQSSSHPCPEETIIAVAMAGVAEYETIHHASDRARGGITLSQYCLDAVRAHFPCEGAVTNQFGHTVCPLADMVRTAMGRMATVWPASNYPLQLDQVTHNEAVTERTAPEGNHTTGQYL